MDRTPLHIHTGNIQSGGNVSIGNQIIHYHQSIEWQNLEKEKDKILDNIRNTKKKIEKYPDDDDFKNELLKHEQELAECNSNIEQFQRDILQLAQKFSQIEINSERRKIAYQAFLDGKYSEARIILETKEATQEHRDLLKQREHLKQQQQENEKKLQHKAEESILLAHLYLISYSLGSERISKAEEYFKLAIDEHNVPQYRLDYAFFLYLNNRFQEAKKIYADTLKQCEELILQDEEKNARYLIRCLKEFAYLLKYYPDRWSEAENYYRKAISVYEKLTNYTKEDAIEFTLLLKEFADLLDYCARYQEAEIYYNKCLEIMKQENINDAVLKAMIFHDFAIMLAKNPTRFNDAEYFHKQALNIRRELPKNQLGALEHLTRSLKSLGKLLSDYPNKYDDAKHYYQEALKYLKKLIEKDENIYRYLEVEIYSNFAMLMNNIWEKSRNKEDAHKAQKYYEKAILSYRNLNILNPDANERALALCLHNYGTLQFELNGITEAQIFYDESLAILEKILKNLSYKNSNDIQDDIALVKTSLANLHSAGILPEYHKASDFYQQALDILMNLVEKQPDIYLKKLVFCIIHVEQFIQNSCSQDESLRKKYEQAVDSLPHNINTKPPKN